MNHEPHDHDEMDDDERELASLYASLPSPAPDAQLDATVRAKARVVHHRRWPVALASAATVMLALGLGWRWQMSMPDLARAPVPTVPAPAATASGVVAATPGSSPRNVEDRLAARTTGGEVVNTREKTPGTSTAPRTPDLAEAPAPAEASTPAPELAKRAASPTDAAATGSSVRPQQYNATATAAAAPLRAPAAATEAPAPIAPPPPPAPPAPPALPTRMPAAPPPDGDSAPAIMSNPTDELLPPMNTPAERAQRIRILERRGQHQAARDEFRALRAAFPGFVVPADLGALAQ
jgi:hypothetical protein